MVSLELERGRTDLGSYPTTGPNVAFQCIPDITATGGEVRAMLYVGSSTHPERFPTLQFVHSSTVVLRRSSLDALERRLQSQFLMRVLVIDDDEVVARSVQRMLREHDVLVDCDAAHAVEVLGKESPDEHPFDLIVCDYEMPEVNGIDVLEATRSLDEPPIFILMSGMSDVRERGAQCDGVVSKPFRRPDLVVQIERAVVSLARAETRPLPRVELT